MTREEAKEILAVYRPGTDDQHDPIFAEALALAHSDPVLTAWLEESTTFDRQLRSALGHVTAPPNLRDAILAERKIIRPHPWWHRKLSAREMAAAAAIVLAVSLAVFWLAQRPVRFDDFRREIADQSWGSAPHVELKTDKLADVHGFLRAQHLSTDFALPSTLAESEIRGCSVMHWHGREIPVLCFSSKGQHLHLAIVERSLFPDAPSNSPQTDRWEAWRTASWSKDNHTYLLTGLSTPAFVKKFRKARRWDWEG
jgi:hypothetical protein